jgi:hypothetical protein
MTPLGKKLFGLDPWWWVDKKVQKKETQIASALSLQFDENKKYYDWKPVKILYFMIFLELNLIIC